MKISRSGAWFCATPTQRGPFSSCTGFRRPCTPGRTSPRLWPMSTRSTLSTGRVMASSRPTVDRLSYAPKDYARILDRYLGKAGIDTSKLTIYATDIGALPTLLLAVERPDV